MRKKLEINLVDVSKSARAEIPEYQTKGASGLDLKADSYTHLTLPTNREV